MAFMPTPSCRPPERKAATGPGRTDSRRVDRRRPVRMRRPVGDGGEGRLGEPAGVGDLMTSSLAHRRSTRRCRGPGHAGVRRSRGRRSRPSPRPYGRTPDPCSRHGQPDGDMRSAARSATRALRFRAAAGRSRERPPAVRRRPAGSPRQDWTRARRAPRRPRAPPGSSAIPSLTFRATHRCCAPSCRSRSSRCRSASCAEIRRRRDVRTSRARLFELPIEADIAQQQARTRRDVGEQFAVGGRRRVVARVRDGDAPNSLPAWSTGWATVRSSTRLSAATASTGTACDRPRPHGSISSPSRSQTTARVAPAPRASTLARSSASPRARRGEREVTFDSTSCGVDRSPYTSRFAARCIRARIGSNSTATKAEATIGSTTLARPSSEAPSPASARRRRPCRAR